MLIDTAAGAPLPRRCELSPLRQAGEVVLLGRRRKGRFPRRACRAPSALARTRSILSPLGAHARTLCGQDHRQQAPHRRGRAQGRAGHRRGLCVRRQGERHGNRQLDHVPGHHRLLALRLSLAATGRRPGSYGRHRRHADGGARLRQRIVQHRDDVRRRRPAASPSSRSTRAWPRNSPISTRRSTAHRATRFCSISARGGRRASSADRALSLRRELRAARLRRPSRRAASRCETTASVSPSSIPIIRVELHATAGQKLSDELQDGHSYRYGIVNLGGRDLIDVLGKFDAVHRALGLELVPVERRPLPTEAEIALAAG